MFPSKTLTTLLTLLATAGFAIAAIGDQAHPGLTTTKPHATVAVDEAHVHLGEITAFEWGRFRAAHKSPSPGSVAPFAGAASFPAPGTVSARLPATMAVSATIG